MNKYLQFFGFLLLWQVSYLKGQSPIITPVALPTPETLHSLPVVSPLHWIVKTGKQYYLRQGSASVLFRDSLGDATWVSPPLPSSWLARTKSMVNVAGPACLVSSVEDVSPMWPGIHREFKILRTGAWSEAEVKFSRIYNEIPGQPSQVADYQTQFLKLTDSILYYLVNLLGVNGGAFGTDIYRSTDAGSSWQQVPVAAHIKAGDYFAFQDNHFLRADNPDFINSAEWPFPDITITSADFRGLFLEADTFYFYTQQGVRWKRTDDMPWQAEQLPFCWINSLHQSQGRCYASTSTGIYKVDHTKADWQELLPINSNQPPYYDNNLVVVDSLDLFVFSYAQGLIHSTDGGYSWQPFHRGLPEQYAFSVGFFGDSLLANAYNISEAGRDWRPFIVEAAGCNSFQRWLPVGQGGFMLSLLRNTGLPQFNGQVLYTPDRSTWIAAAPVPDYNNLPYLFYQQQRLWLVGSGAAIYSDDLGQHWDTLSLPDPASGYPDPIFGWITQGDTIIYVDYEDKLHRTTDFGQHWSIPTIPALTGNAVSNWIFRQRNKLLVCTNGGKIWSSDDWGNSWIQTCSGLPGYTESSFMYYGMKYDSVLSVANFLTLDAGQHWVQMTGSLVPTSPEGLAWNNEWLYFSNYQKGIYRIPSGDIIYRLVHPDSSGIVSVQNINNVHEWHIQPNPAHHQINITGSVPAFFTWQIMDVSGRTISKGAGHKNPINIETLRAGVYFIKMQTNTQTSTQPFMVTD